jgi:hypothetical protein
VSIAEKNPNPILWTLVACVAAKHPTPVAARDLYVSDWFRKARAYVEATGREWRILSALHGLVNPDVVVAPYEKTLAKLDREDRRHWAWNVAFNVRCATPLDVWLRPNAPKPVVEILAGELYREPLIEELRGRGFDVVVPMLGMGIGQQKAWLKSAAAAAKLAAVAS